MRTLKAIIIALTIIFTNQLFATQDSSGFDTIEPWPIDLIEVEEKASELAYQSNKMQNMLEDLLYSDYYNNALQDAEKYANILHHKAHDLIDLTYAEVISEEDIVLAFEEIKELYIVFSRNYRKLLRSSKYRYDYELKSNYNGLRVAYYELHKAVTGETGR